MTCSQARNHGNYGCPNCTATVGGLERAIAAERERSARAEAKAEQYERDWCAAKSEFGDAMAKMSEKERAAQARAAEMVKAFDALWARYQYVELAANLCGEMNQLRIAVESARDLIPANEEGGR